MKTHEPEKHPLVSAVMRALPIRSAVELRARLKSGEESSPALRAAVRNAVRKAGKVLKDA